MQSDCSTAKAYLQGADIITYLCWMNAKTVLLLIAVLFSFLLSCNRNAAEANRIIVIQPFEGFNPTLSKTIYKEISDLHSSVILRPTIALPQEAYYTPRKRYRAEVLLRHLSKLGSVDTVVIGLTHKDISTTKGNVHDWGILGLGYCPGPACVVSTFRLAKTNLHEQFYKVALHELGHTQGLPHCPERTCFMRDAEGGNPLNEETGFCASCMSFLESKGWRFK